MPEPQIIDIPVDETEDQETALARREAAEIVGDRPTTPTDLLELAVAQGAGLEQLDRLLDLQLRWEANEARKAYVAAMAKFKAEAPSVLAKDKLVDFTGKTGKRTRYTHATLGGIIESITPALSANGLSVGWDVAQEDRGGVTVTCIVTHAQGHSERVSMTGPRDDSGNKNAIQMIGSAVTYLQRYTLLSALGLATADQDDDGVASGARGRQEPTSRPQSGRKGNGGQRSNQQDNGRQGRAQPSRDSEDPAPQEQQEQPQAGDEQRIAKALAFFQAFGVCQADAERYIGDMDGEPAVPAGDWGPGDFEALQKAARKIKQCSGTNAQMKLARELFALDPGAQG